jgi:uncharacterized protein
MKILIDILHPAQANFLRNFIKIMQKHGHEILVTARKKDVTLQILDAYNIKYEIISELKNGFFNLALELLTRTYKLIKITKKFKPDILLGAMGPSISLAGKILKIPSLVFYNNETAKLTNWYVYKLATRYITSTSYEDKVYGKHVTYKGYHELAYLHPNYFTPSKAKLKKLGINPDKKYFLLRFVSWQSSHDLGAKGFANKIKFVKELAREGQVIISSEKNLPKELEKYAMNIPPQYLSDLIAFAHLTAGESASVASDSACLGVPAIYLANTKRGYTNEQDKKFGLVYNYTDQQQALEKTLQLAKRSKRSIQQEFQKKRQTMLNYTNDITKWMVLFVENFYNNSKNK